jgi:hypothetical protein
MEQYSDREIRQLVRLSSRRYFQNVAGSFRSLQVEVFIALAAEAARASMPYRLRTSASTLAGSKAGDRVRDVYSSTSATQEC